MSNVKVIEVNQSVYAANNSLADETRAELKKAGTFMINLMASPGAGKTTTLLRTVSELKSDYRIGILEADIDATVDAQKMQDAGVDSLQVHTGGECAMNAGMTKKALEEFTISDYDLLFLENVGNLVCPAEEDVGASKRVAILSYPEGDDKPLKYPLMFEVCDAVLINKIDTGDYFDFDDEKVKTRILNLNPASKIFFVSAKTGQGFDKWIDWLKQEVKEWKEN